MTDSAGATAVAASEALPGGGVDPQPEAAASIDAWIVHVIAGLACLGVLPLGPAPTGIGWWDLLLTVGFVASVVHAGSRAGIAALGWAATFAIISLAFVGPSIWILYAIAGFALAWLAETAQRLPVSNRALAAASSAASLVALFRIGDIGFWGLPSLVTVVAAVPLLSSAWRSRSETSTRWTRPAAKIAALLGLVCIVSLAVTALRSQGPARSAAEAARRGIDAISAGETEDAAAQLNLAALKLEDAGAAVDGPLAGPARLLPVVSQHLRVGSVGLRHGATLSSVGADAIAASNLDAIRRSDGSFDIAGLEDVIASMNAADEVLGPASEDLAAQSDDWLVSPVAVFLGDGREGLADAAQLSSEFNPLLQVVPELLGREAPMRYFVLFGTPAEARELGGLLGGYAVVEVDDGRIKLVEAGNNTDLIERSRSEGLDLDFAGYTEFFVNIYEPDTYAQNFTGIPDLTLAAQAIHDVFGDFAGAPIDGVLYLDPYALESIVRLAGPLRVSGVDTPLNGRNTADFLLRGQYVAFEDPEERKEFLVSMLEQTFSSLLSMDLTNPRQVATVMAPIVRGGRLQLAMIDEDLNDRVARTDLLRRWPGNDGADFVALLQSNAAPTKLDTYLFRDWTYDLRYDPASGDVSGTVRLELTSTAPADLPSYVTQPDSVVLGAEDRRPIDNWTFVSLISPLQTTELRTNSAVQNLVHFDELGYNRWFAQASVAPEQPTIIEWDVFGSLSPGDYVLRLAHQPLVNDDRVRVTVTPVDGWTLDGGSSTWSFVLTENVTLIARAARQ